MAPDRNFEQDVREFIAESRVHNRALSDTLHELKIELFGTGASGSGIKSRFEVLEANHAARAKCPPIPVVVEVKHEVPAPRPYSLKSSAIRVVEQVVVWGVILALAGIVLLFMKHPDVITKSVGGG